MRTAASSNEPSASARSGAHASTSGATVRPSPRRTRPCSRHPAPDGRTRRPRRPAASRRSRATRRARSFQERHLRDRRRERHVDPNTQPFARPRSAAITTRSARTVRRSVTTVASRCRPRSRCIVPASRPPLRHCGIGHQARIAASASTVPASAWNRASHQVASRSRGTVPETGRVELVERHVASPASRRPTRRASHRVPDRPDRLDQERDALRRLEPSPTVERFSSESDVPPVVVGDPDGS